MGYKMMFALYGIAYLLLCTSALENVPEVNENFPATLENSLKTLPTKWVSEIMGEAETAFDMDPNVSKKCAEDIKTYKLHAENQTVWAVRMMESSEWPRMGLFSGVTFHLGNWAECLRSRGPDIKGQYCLVEATYNFTYDEFEQPAPGWVDWPAENESVWKILKMYEKSRIRVDRQTLTWAVCIPSSCTPEDVRMSVDNTVRPIFNAYNLDVSVRVDPVTCNVKEAPHYTAGYYNARSFFMFLIFIVMLGTICDIYTAKSKGQTSVPEEGLLPIEILKCFSVIRSYIALTAYSPNESYLFLYFLKSVASISMVLGHALLIYHGFPKLHTEHAELLLKPWTMELLLTNLVHVFFLISGFMAAHKFDFNSNFGTGLSYSIYVTFFRWLRLMFPYVLLVIYFVFISGYSGDGPLWNRGHKLETDFCTANWWTTVLLVNNIVNPRGMCFTTSWYIAADIHMFMIVVALLVIYRRNSRLGTRLMVVTFLYFVAKTFLNIYVNKYDGFFIHLPKDFTRYRDALTSVWYSYGSTSFRAAPYLIGSATAMLTAKLKQTSYQFSRIQTILIPLLLSIIGFGVQTYAFLFYMEGRPYCALEHAVFGAFHSILFVLPIASLICIYFVSGLGSFNTIIDFPMYVPLGRITYCLYLVSYPLQMYHYMIQKRVLIGLGRMDMYWWGVTDVIYSLAVSFILFLISEGPMISLAKLLLPRLVKVQTKLDKEMKEPPVTVPSSEEKSTTEDSLRQRKVQPSVQTSPKEE